MKNRSHACDPVQIESFLRQDLSEQDQVTFEEHLDECMDCRRELESTAATKDVWGAVRESLLSESPFRMGITSYGESDDSSQFIEPVLRSLAPSDDERMLGRLGTYEILGVIGEGGMGVVLKALDPSLNRYVAIKVKSPNLCHNGSARKRFLREAEAAAAVIHDSVLEIYGIGESAGMPYLVMPYVRGRSLQRRIDDEGALSTLDIVRIGMQTAAGLSAAHAQGLVHRDVKPGNILLADDGTRVKLTDFGLAQAADDSSLTKTGVIAGTPQYMSPEQARGEAVDCSSDLFSLGSVLYAMCTGRPPFRAETSYGILRRITDESPRPIQEINPSIPLWLVAVIGKLMSKQIADRYSTAEEVAELLEACLAHLQQPMAIPLPRSLQKLQRLPNRRPPWFWPSIAIALLFAFSTSGILIVLETNQGTLRIESEAEDVMVRIQKGNETVERFTVTKAGKSTRLKAGEYTIELEDSGSILEVTDKQVVLKRGEVRIAKIAFSHTNEDQRISHVAPSPFRTSDPARGRIVSLDSKGEIVMINLGKKDGVREGMEFIGVTAALKSRIHISQVFEATSQGRVVWREPSVPFMPEDEVYSPYLDQRNAQFDSSLRELEKLLSNGESTLSEVPHRVDRLLADYPERASQIHWQAAHLYGLSGVQEYASQVIEHASRGIADERDPLRRAYLIRYLSLAWEAQGNSSVAIDWFLKGWFELHSLHLPPSEPELPLVGKYRDALIIWDAEKKNPVEQKLLRQLVEAEQKKWREAEITRELVRFRTLYVNGLRRLNPNNESQEKLRARVMQMLEDGELPALGVETPKALEILIRSLVQKPESNPFETTSIIPSKDMNMGLRSFFDRQRGELRITSPALGELPLSLDVAFPITSPIAESVNFCFSIGFRR